MLWPWYCVTYGTVTTPPGPGQWSPPATQIFNPLLETWRRGILVWGTIALTAYFTVMSEPKVSQFLQTSMSAKYIATSKLIWYKAKCGIGVDPPTNFHTLLFTFSFVRPFVFLDVAFVLEMSYCKFLVSRMSKGHQRHTYPPTLELDPWRTGGFWHTLWFVLIPFPLH